MRSGRDWAVLLDVRTYWAELKPYLVSVKPYLIVLGKKMGWVAGAWVVLYFSTQWMREGIPTLLAPVVGSVAGLVIGWWLAQEAVEEAGFSGLLLWVLLVLGAWVPISGVEWVLGRAMPRLVEGWTMGFGRWMMYSAALLVSMAAAVWRASADD